jgi:hypothetical protein
MYRRLLSVARVLALLVARVHTAVAGAWGTAIAADVYRPEAHYMRGPGPKWRAKHAPVSARP